MVKRRGSRLGRLWGGFVCVESIALRSYRTRELCFTFMIGMRISHGDVWGSMIITFWICMRAEASVDNDGRNLHRRNSCDQGPPFFFSRGGEQMLLLDAIFMFCWIFVSTRTSSLKLRGEIQTLGVVHCVQQ